MVIIFITGNLKDYLMKELILLKHPILVYSKLRLLWYKTRVEFNGSCSRQDMLHLIIEK